MIVIAAIGGAVVGGGIIAAAYEDYSVHSEHSDYSNAAEIMKRKVAAAEQDAEAAARDVHNFKVSDVNPKLKSEALRSQSAMTVREELLDQDAREKIQEAQAEAVQQETKAIREDIQTIDELLSRIEKLKAEEGAYGNA